jgi:YjjG family noncanonical pyrimidine nucleotidase
MRYDWLLFDADGTLFDYDKAERSALQQTLEVLGVLFQPHYLTVYGRVNAEMWQAFERGEIAQDQLKLRRFELLSEAIDVPLDPAQFSDTYLLQLGQNAHLIDGAEAMLQALYNQVNMMLITNGLQAVQRSRYALSPLPDYFADIVISEEVGVAKPAPGIFDIAFRKMGNPAKERVLIIGDSLSSDMAGGIHYGIDTCWFNPEGRERGGVVGITYEIRDLAELPGILAL